jgi:hypothetical protein
VVELKAAWLGAAADVGPETESDSGPDAQLDEEPGAGG